MSPGQMNQQNMSYSEASLNRSVSQEGPGQNGTGMLPQGVEQGAKSTTGTCSLCLFLIIACMGYSYGTYLTVILQLYMTTRSSSTITTTTTTTTIAGSKQIYNSNINYKIRADFV
jgi:hypothetical protein